MSLKYQSTYISISADNMSKKPKIEQIDSKTPNIHTLYSTLQTHLNDDNRSLISVSNKEFEFKCQNNKSKTGYNTAGNLSFSCYIPMKDELAPNYIGLIINDKTNEGDNPKFPLMRILTDWIKSDDMMTYYYFSTNLVKVNNVPPIDIKSIIKNGFKDGKGDEYCLKWWNYGREKWGADNGTLARNLCQVYGKKLNELFDYIIKNDLIVADSEFQKRLFGLFASSSSQSSVKLNDDTKRRSYTPYLLYPYSNGALILPSLVNFIADKINVNNHALVYCGYIPKGSRIFVSNDNETELVKDKTKYRDDETKMKEDAKITPFSVGIFNINDGLKDVGTTNYPFTVDNTNQKPHVLDNKSVNSLIDESGIKTNPPLTDLVFKPYGSDKYNFTNDEKYEYNENVLKSEVLGDLVPNKEKKEGGSGQTVEKLVKETRTVDIIIPLGCYLKNGRIDSSPTGCNNGGICQSDDNHGCDHCPWHDNACINRKIGICWDYWSWGGTHASSSGSRTDNGAYITNTLNDAFLDPNDKTKVNDRFLNALKQWIYYAETQRKFDADWFNFINPTHSNLNVKFNDIKEWDIDMNSLSYTNNVGLNQWSVDYGGSNPTYYKKRTATGDGGHGKTATYEVCDAITDFDQWKQSRVWGNKNVVVVNDGNVNHRNAFNNFMNTFETGYNNELPNYNRKMTITYTITYIKKLESFVGLTGTYGTNTPTIYIPSSRWRGVSSFNSAIDSIRSLAPLISMSEMSKNLYVFNDNTFKFWMEVINSADGCQLVLNELRSYIKEHVEMTLLNKVCQYMRPYVKKMFNQNSQKDVSFINIPFGPPLVHMPKTLLFDTKFFHASYEVKQNPKYSKYNVSKPNLNIVSSISSTMATNNYMDLMLREMINTQMLENRGINDDTYFTMLIPDKGQSICNVVSDSLAGVLNSKYILTAHDWTVSDGDSSSAFNTTIPKILLSFRSLSENKVNDRISALSSNYNFIDSVSVPIICFHHENQSDMYAEVRIDTRSEGNVQSTNNEQEGQPVIEHYNKGANINDTGKFVGKCQLPTKNVLYIYVSNNKVQDFTSNIRGKKMQNNDSDVNIDPKTNIAHTMVNINYKGLDAMYPSNCIRRRDTNKLYSVDCKQIMNE